MHASDVHVQLFVSDLANLEPTASRIAIQSNNTQTSPGSRAVHI